MATTAITTSKSLDAAALRALLQKGEEETVGSATFRLDLTLRLLKCVPRTLFTLPEMKFIQGLLFRRFSTGRSHQP